MNNKLIYNDHLNFKKVLTTLEDKLLNCDEFFISVAFISESGLTSLLQTLKTLENKNVKGKILTTNYLYFNTPKTLDKINNFSNIELKIFDCEEHSVGFHTKAYIFIKNDNTDILLGSSNLTINALTTNKEWNTLTKSNTHSPFAKEVMNNFLNLWTLSKKYNHEKYSSDYQRNKNPATLETTQNLAKVFTPNSMQKSFINKFTALRKNHSKALLISATGTGKTFACAFAMKEVKAKKILFVVHREQIAKKSLDTFKTIFGNKRTYGLLSGNSKNTNCDFLFTTIQTLSKDNILNSFKKDEFDEIIIDEVHRAGANSYLKIIDYFSPKFFLGMTASPDRTDGFNIYELFDNNIVYEIRLKEALEENLLCPFHYFGISDIEIDEEITNDLTFSNLTSDERVKHIIEKINYYGYSGKRVKGLIFCSSKEEAKELSSKFNINGFKTTYLTGEDSTEKREQQIKKLTTNNNEDYLDYIFTVDIFNEGIDIPEINQIVMLRPTQSSIIFIQQLGRGLRKSNDKDFVVIIDFIANYKNNFLIPIALSGDNSYDKDNIRNFVAEGIKYIPGNSTIHFDEISKNKIYEAIDNAKLNNCQLIYDQYLILKNKLGTIPTYIDFENYDTIDIKKIFLVAGNYYNFLCKKEKNYINKNKLNPTENNMLTFVSQNLILSKKIEELELLKLLISEDNNIKEKFRKIMKEKYNKNLRSFEIETSIKILTNNFVTSSVTKNKFSDCVFLNYSDDIYIDKKFSSLLKDEFFKSELIKLLNYGIFRYNKYYKNNLYKNTNFALYKKYSYEDICKLFNWSINYVPLAIGGYKYDEKTKTLPVFINYDIDENSFNHDYTHGFLPNNGFTSMSKPKRNLESKECEYFYDKETRIYLFMRKNKKDKETASEFYFLGEMTTIDEPKLVTRKKSEDTVVQFFFTLDTPVREDLLAYFTKDRV